jgi:hypothetical protein
MHDAHHLAKEVLFQIIQSASGRLEQLIDQARLLGRAGRF